MQNSSLYVVVLKDKAGIEFVRFGTTLNFEIRKEQHISGLKNGYFFQNGERKDYRFFHDTRVLGKCSKRTRKSLLAKTAIRNQLVKKAREGKLKIGVRELYSGEPEVVALVERVLIHAFLYTSRALNHYNDRGGEVAGTLYCRPTSSRVTNEVREAVCSILGNFDASADVRERASDMIRNWFNPSASESDCLSRQKQLAQENAKKARVSGLFSVLRTAVASGKDNGSKSRVLAESYKQAREQERKGALAPYSQRLEATAEFREIESKMQYHGNLAKMSHEDFMDMGGTGKVAALQATREDAELLQEMLSRRQERDEHLGIVQMLSQQLGRLKGNVLVA